MAKMESILDTTWFLHSGTYTLPARLLGNRIGGGPREGCIYCEWGSIFQAVSMGRREAFVSCFIAELLSWRK